jgi:hypothetical protein
MVHYDLMAKPLKNILPTTGDKKYKVQKGWRYLSMNNAQQHKSATQQAMPLVLKLATKTLKTFSVKDVYRQIKFRDQAYLFLF